MQDMLYGSCIIYRDIYVLDGMLRPFIAPADYIYKKYRIHDQVHAFSVAASCSW